jgi:transposase
MSSHKHQERKRSMKYYAGLDVSVKETAIATENDIRGLLRNFGLKVGIIGTVGLKARIGELIDGKTDVGEIISPLLAAREKLRAEFA